MAMVSSTVGSPDHHGLEPARQCRVLLDVLPVFGQRGSADAAQFAARESRLQHIGGIDGAFRAARADQGMQLVDEADDLAVRFRDFLENGFEAVFEFAAELGARDHLAEVDRDQFLVAQLIRHVAPQDALRQTFDNGGLADAGLADQHRIVLRAPAQHLHDAADLVVAADHRVQLAFAGLFGEIDGVALQRLILRFRILVGDALRAAHRHQSFENLLVVGALPVEKRAGGLVFLIRKRQQKMFGRDVLVLEILRFLKRAFENLIQGRRDVHAGRLAGDFGDGGELAFRFANQRIGLDAALFQHGTHNTLPFPRQRNQKMERMHRLISVLRGDFLRLLNGFLCLLS